MHGEVPAEELSADVLSAVERNIPAATRHFVEFAATVARAPEQVRKLRCSKPSAPKALIQRTVEALPQHCSCRCVAWPQLQVLNPNSYCPGAAVLL